MAADVLSQLRRGALEYCVLALLVDEERYGFDIVRTLGSIDGMVTGEGTLYPLLSRLKKDGHVTTATAYVAASLVVGLAASFAGMLAARRCTGRGRYGAPS